MAFFLVEPKFALLITFFYMPYEPMPLLTNSFLFEHIELNFSSTLFLMIHSLYYNIEYFNSFATDLPQLYQTYN